MNVVTERHALNGLPRLKNRSFSSWDSLIFGLEVTVNCCFVCFSEAAEKTAEQLDGLTVGGEKDGAKGEGIISMTLVV